MKRALILFVCLSLISTMASAESGKKASCSGSRARRAAGIALSLLATAASSTTMCQSIHLHGSTTAFPFNGTIPARYQNGSATCEFYVCPVTQTYANVLSGQSAEQGNCCSWVTNPEECQQYEKENPEQILQRGCTKPTTYDPQFGPAMAATLTSAATVGVWAFSGTQEDKDEQNKEGEA